MSVDGAADEDEILERSYKYVCVWYTCQYKNHLFKLTTTVIKHSFSVVPINPDSFF